MIALSVEERNKFVAWLEQEADSDKSIIDQLQKLKVSQALVQRRRAEIAGLLLTANRIRSIESTTIMQSDSEKLSPTESAHHGYGG